MRTSSERILTTHVGSLIRPPALQEIMRAKQARQPYDATAYESCLRDAVAEVVRRQGQIGIDVVSDGEYGKSISWNQYIIERMSGFTLRPNPPGPGGRSGDPGLDRNRFKEFYAELDARDPPANPNTVVCVGPVAYTGQAELARDIANFKRRSQPRASRKASCPWWRPRARCRSGGTNITAARRNGCMPSLRPCAPNTG